nr:hypothetical protein GCM10017611_59210 [Rhodococcus wratislaviensis]
MRIPHHGRIDVRRQGRLAVPHSLRVRWCRTGDLQHRSDPQRRRLVAASYRTRDPTYEDSLRPALLAFLNPGVGPVDVSNALVFASQETRFITGVTLPVEGGSAAV